MDIIAIHGYGTGDYDTNNIKTYVQQAEANGKKLLYQEWGSCYFDTENNDCPTGEPLDSDQRSNNIKTWANQIADAGAWIASNEDMCCEFRIYSYFYRSSLDVLGNST